jgi:Fe-S cluster assembly iron-binding protein IscA
MNPHSEYLQKRINDIIKSGKWNINIINTSHEDFIKNFNSCVFTNLIQSTFGKGYVKKHKCAECKVNPAAQRCHGENEDRPILLKRALERVYPDTTKMILLKEIVIAFLEEHLNSKFDFKCESCHARETSAQRKAAKVPESNPPSGPQPSSSQPASPPKS